MNSCFWNVTLIVDETGKVNVDDAAASSQTGLKFIAKFFLGEKFLCFCKLPSTIQSGQNHENLF